MYWNKNYNYNSIILFSVVEEAEVESNSVNLLKYRTSVEF